MYTPRPCYDHPIFTTHMRYAGTPLAHLHPISLFGKVNTTFTFHTNHMTRLVPSNEHENNTVVWERDTIEWELEIKDRGFASRNGVSPSTVLLDLPLLISWIQAAATPTHPLPSRNTQPGDRQRLQGSSKPPECKFWHHADNSCTPCSLPTVLNFNYKTRPLPPPHCRSSQLSKITAQGQGFIWLNVKVYLIVAFGVHSPGHKSP